MRHKRFGFTLIEVSLFLAVTGALFVAILVGTQNSIWQQRYNDATQSFTNFIRNVYAEVSNPQGLGDGRSDLAIYGRLITFGESVGLDGQNIPNDEQKFFVYDVIGDATSDSGMSGPIADVLMRFNATVVVAEKDDFGVETGGFVPAGITTSYSPIWGSVVEKALVSDEATEFVLNDLYKGSILIVRHPVSGTIMTLSSNKIIEVNGSIRAANGGELAGSRVASPDVLLTSALENNEFTMTEVNFCVNPYGLGETGSLRRNVRILKNAHNASGVELVDLDSADNKCLAS